MNYNSRSQHLEFSAFKRPDAPLPIEYRYSTRYPARLAAGAALLLCGFLFQGAWGWLLAGVGLVGILTGLPGVLGDPAGFWRTPGHRVVVTDEQIEEVDERGCVRWQFLAAEILSVRVVRRGMPLPEWVLPGGRSETWCVELKERPAVEVPVWLLPGQGTRFKSRFAEFVRRSGSTCWLLGQSA